MEAMVGKGILYKWEDSPALDHKCGTCKTVLSSPRAKKTCFGIHEEVCSKYHNTLFFVGEAHKCEACRKSAELHDKRLREIATLHQSLQQLDAANQPETFRTSSKRKETVEHAEDDFSVLSDTSTAPSILAHGEITGSTANLNGKMPCKKERKAMKKARNWIKSRSQIKILTTEHVKFIHDALHTPKPTPLGTRSHSRNNSSSLRKEGIIADSLAYNPKTFQYHKWTAGRKLEAKSTPNSKTAPRYQEVPSEILDRLRIEVDVQGASRERKSIVAKLCEAIRNDLTIVENEERETMMRKAGYWRYVNTKTFNLMVENNQIWDWVSGQKMTPVIEKEEPAEDDEEDGWDRDIDLVENEQLTCGHSADGTSTVSTQETSYDDAHDTSDTKSIFETSTAGIDRSPTPEPVPEASVEGEEDSADGSGCPTVDTSYFVVNLEPESLYD